MQLLTVWRASLRQTWRERRIDACRIALQSVVAATVTCSLIASLFGADYLSWAIFSSLFTIQTHVDTSLRRGMGQIAGTVLGTLVGLACIGGFGDDINVALRVGIAIVLTGGIGVLWPSMTYAPVAAAMIALQPEAALHPAILRALAISIGATVGVAASSLIWPQLGRQRTFHSIANAIDDCSGLLDRLRGLPAESDDSAVSQHEGSLCHLEAARALAGDTRFRARFSTGVSLYAAIREVEQLWHGLTVLERAVSEQSSCLPEADRDALQTILTELADRAEAFLAGIAQFVRGTGAIPSPEALTETVDTLKRRAYERLDDAMHEAPSLPRFRALDRLIFGIDQVCANLAQLGRLLRGGTLRRGHALRQEGR